MQQARTRVDAVVEVYDGVVEEDVAAELAREGSARLQPLGEHVGVAGAPHDRLAAVVLDVFHQGERAFHVEDDGPTRLFFEGFAGVEDHVHVGPQDVAVVVNHAQAVAVAINADAHVRALLLDLGYQVNYVLLFQRVGQVVGEIAVRLDIDAGHVAAEGPVYLQRSGACDAVAGVNYDFQGALDLHGVGDVLDVVWFRELVSVFALAVVELAALDDAVKLLHVV